MKTSTLAVILTAVMCAASVGSIAARPDAKAGERGKSISLKTMVPETFGDWTVDPERGAAIVDPQTQKTLDSIYSQLLTRTYVHKSGYRIMLSMAYGDDQRGGLQAHRPEVCYPAQGFQVRHLVDGQVVTPYGPIEVRRLDTKLQTRNEPVTYWLTVGDQVIRNQFEKRMAQIRLGLTGQIPDGLLFRVSSIDDDTGRAYAMQGRFAADLMSAVPAETRRQLSGLTPPASAS